MTKSAEILSCVGKWKVVQRLGQDDQQLDDLASESATKMLKCMIIQNDMFKIIDVLVMCVLIYFLHLLDDQLYEAMRKQVPW